MPGPVRDAPDGALLSLRVIPRAKRSEIAGLRGDAVLVRLAAPPVDGAGNAALLEVLSAWLGVPRQRLALVAGERARHKTVRITGLSAADVDRRIERS